MKFSPTQHIEWVSVWKCENGSQKNKCSWKFYKPWWRRDQCHSLKHVLEMIQLCMMIIHFFLLYFSGTRRASEGFLRFMRKNKCRKSRKKLKRRPDLELDLEKASNTHSNKPTHSALVSLRFRNHFSDWLNLKSHSKNIVYFNWIWLLKLFFIVSHFPHYFVVSTDWWYEVSNQTQLKWSRKKCLFLTNWLSLSFRCAHYNELSQHLQLSQPTNERTICGYDDDDDVSC